MSLILILAGVFFSLLSSPRTILAGEDYDHMFNNTIAYTIGEVPTSSPVGSIEYDVNTLFGESTTTFFNAHNISTLTTTNGVLRLPNIGDSISAPPGSRIDILYFYENKKSTTVNVKDILVPMSSTEEIVTSYSNITDAQTEFNAVFIPHNGVIFRRPGYYGRYPVGLTIPPAKRGSFVLGSIYVRNPIEVVSASKLLVDDDVNVKIELKNTSNDDLEDLELLHLDKSISFSIDSQGTKVLEYTIQKDLFSVDGNGELKMGTVFVKNKEECRKCGIGDVDPIKLLGMYTHSVFYSNLTGGISGGSFFIPKDGSFCITRIPYTMMIREFVEGDIDEIPNGGNGENNGSNENNGGEGNSSVNDNVLGENTSGNNDGSVDVVNYNHESLAVLPDTGKRVGAGILLFLVVDLYLWYSYFREKKKYGSKNKDTKICTRYSKDSA